MEKEIYRLNKMEKNKRQKKWKMNESWRIK